MSEQLTNEQLDDIQEGANHGFRVALPDMDVLISMARRCLSAEERLGNAVSAIRLQQRNWDEELVRLEILRETGGPKEAWVKACRRECQRAVDELLDGPKAIHPPVECAPHAEPDVLPVVCQHCHGRGGWEGGLTGETWYECPECNGVDPSLNEMRKGLDDHSCNTTGWEK